TRPPPFERVAVQLAAVHCDTARLRGEQPGDKIDERRLARPRTAADAEPLAAVQLQRGLLEAEVGLVLERASIELKFAPFEWLGYASLSRDSLEAAEPTLDRR